MSNKNESTAPDTFTPDGDKTSIIERSEDGLHYATHDMSTEGLCLTISRALAELTGRPAIEVIPEISKYADPDALDRIFRERTDGTPRTGGFVELFIEGYAVRIDCTGLIEIEDTGVTGGSSTR